MLGLPLGENEVDSQHELPTSLSMIKGPSDVFL